MQLHSQLLLPQRQAEELLAAVCLTPHRVPVPRGKPHSKFKVLPRNGQGHHGTSQDKLRQGFLLMWGRWCFVIKSTAFPEGVHTRSKRFTRTDVLSEAKLTRSSVWADMSTTTGLTAHRRLAGFKERGVSSRAGGASSSSLFGFGVTGSCQQPSDPRKMPSWPRVATLGGMMDGAWKPRLMA